MESCLLVQGGDAFDLEVEVEKRGAHPERFSGADISTSKLEEALFSPSFFEEKLVVIEEADKLKGRALDLVKAFAKRPSPKVSLILHTPGKSEFASLMPAVTIAEVKPWEKKAKMAEWINTCLKSRKVKASPQVLDALAPQGISDRFLLVSELEKLLTYIGEQNEITLQDIQAVGAIEEEHTVWELVDAFLQRDKNKACRLARELLEQQVSPFLVVRSIRNSVHQALMMLSLSESGTSNVQEHFPQLKGRLFEKNFTLAKQAGATFLTSALLKLDRAERALKDSPFDEETLLLKAVLC